MSSYARGDGISDRDANNLKAWDSATNNVDSKNDVYNIDDNNRDYKYINGEWKAVLYEPYKGSDVRLLDVRSEHKDKLDGLRLSRILDEVKKDPRW